jgi:hypothetical protein
MCLSRQRHLRKTLDSIVADATQTVDFTTRALKDTGKLSWSLSDQSGMFQITAKK